MNPLDMSNAEAAWVTWAMSSTVDTGGYCDCGHEGLGVSWHLDTCRGASYALRNKVMELLRMIDGLPEQVADMAPSPRTVSFDAGWGQAVAALRRAVDDE